MHLQLTHKKLVNDFRKDHAHNARLYPGPKFSYIITPTGIGNKVVITCNVCGQNKDVTNYGSW